MCCMKLDSLAKNKFAKQLTIDRKRHINTFSSLFVRSLFSTRFAFDYTELLKTVLIFVQFQLKVPFPQMKRSNRIVNIKLVFQSK